MSRLSAQARGEIFRVPEHFHATRWSRRGLRIFESTGTVLGSPGLSDVLSSSAESALHRDAGRYSLRSSPRDQLSPGRNLVRRRVK